MRFQLLGPLSIADGENAVVLQPSKPTSLLAALLSHPNTVVATGYLLRALWDDEQPATARAALQTCVLRLRRIFSKYGIADSAIEAVPGGYRMPADAGTLDLVHFRELVGRSRQAADVESELYLLKEALALWQGPLLANVSSQMLHRDEVPRLTEERLRALERACDIELALGRCRQVLVELWEAARTHPGHERFSEQLIEALYRTGRQAEAFAEYRRVKTRLKEELGVDPGPSLQRLELSILRGDDLGGSVGNGPPALPAAPPPGAPAVPPSAELPSAELPSVQLPSAGPPSAAVPEAVPSAAALTVPVPVRPVSCFTGRAADCESIGERLTREQAAAPDLVVVTGAPGIGKTALALHTAHGIRGSFPGGVFVLPMVRGDGSAVTADEAHEALDALGPAGAGDPVGASGGPAGRRLIVFDDVTAADQVRPLLPAAAGSAVIVTSRRGLAGLVATHGGHVHRLGTFRAEESRQLLVNTLGAQRVEAEPEAADRLAVLCGHFPLSLRIAAARLLTRPTLRIADCADWLAEDLPVRLALADDPRMSVPNIFQEALDRIEPRLAEVFVRVGSGESAAFTGLDDAGITGAGPPAATEQILEQLADAGLLEEGPPGPYRMHGLLRCFARRLSGDPGRDPGGGEAHRAADGKGSAARL
ncbi:AfsR/SARP family transcriptional regulator [Streptomyces abyssalis]|uniref:AfsR/SARP family transcriptional regulator n=1 Tax=Streptomyces abyssalis TaxID=933944 RepID=UPI00085BF22A|nr:AfsR/SARP family transcriptional regulator [Streptomyces abyssalis]